MIQKFPNAFPLKLTLDGRSDQAIAQGEQAIRMSPHDPQNALFNVALAAAHYLAGRYNEAIVCGCKAMQQRFGLTNSHRVYIAGSNVSPNSVALCASSGS